MKTYPTIGRQIIKSVPFYVFDKLDGSNIRAEWTKKKGFNKFGRRNGLLDDSNPILKKAIPLFEKKYTDDLTSIFNSMHLQKTTVFFEFGGPQSFAGNHIEDDKHDVVLFDVAIHPKGFVGPSEFLKKFGHLDIPKLLHRGNVTSEIEEMVKNGTLEGMTFEGVVCKGPNESPGMPAMFKIKSLAWLEKLKSFCKDDDNLFQMLQ